MITIPPDAFTDVLKVLIETRLIVQLTLKAMPCDYNNNILQRLDQGEKEKFTL